MLIPGLVSVTFRGLSRLEIAGLMNTSGLSAIEWGGDVHVPCPDHPLTEQKAEEVGDAVREAAYCSMTGRFYTASYGSYYRCDTDFNANLRTAVELEAPNIRVWAGRRGSTEADEGYRKNIVSSLQLLCDVAQHNNMTVSTEFHGGTLTDHYESCLRLINEVERDNFYTYWQPDQFRGEEYDIVALKAVLPYLSNVHVFTWAGHDKFPLADGEKRWRRYIDILRSHKGTHHMLLEFVCDDTTDQFYRDSETLLSWLG